MALPIHCLMVPIRFAVANPTVRVTLAGTPETLVLTVARFEDHWLSGDRDTVANRRDLCERLEACLRTHSGAGAGSFTVTLSEDNFLTITCSGAFTLHWGDVLTTVDPTVFGWPAVDTGSASTQVAPDQSKGFWSPDIEARFDSEDDPVVIGGIVETNDENARGVHISTTYERRVSWHVVPKGKVKNSAVDAAHPHGALEYFWIEQGLARGAPCRIYGDRGVRTTTSYALYRARPQPRPWERQDSLSILRYDIELSFVRIAPPNDFVSNLSADFDGVDEHLVAANSPSLQITGAMTVAAWVKKDTSWTSGQTILGKWLPNTQNSWRWRVEASGFLRFYIATSLTDTGGTFGRINQPSAGPWHHIVMVYNPAGANNAERLRIYVDGVAQTVVFSGTIPAALTGGTAALTGAAHATPGEYFGAGNLDQIAIYNDALTDDEVAAVYNLGDVADLARLSSAGRLVSWWPIGESDTHPTIRDRIGTNHFAMVNMEAGDLIADVP